MKYATNAGSATNASNATSARQVDVNGGGLVYGESGDVNFRMKNSSGAYSYTSVRSLQSNIDSLWTCVVSPQTQQCTFPLYAYDENDKCIKVSFIFLPRADLWSITSNISWDFGANKTADWSTSKWHFEKWFNGLYLWSNDADVRYLFGVHVGKNAGALGIFKFTMSRS